jgi:hypothetical protein
MQMGAHINMELSIEKIRYYAVPYTALLKGPRWFFYLLYPNTYDASSAPGEDYAGRPWYIVPHAPLDATSRHLIFSFLCITHRSVSLGNPSVTTRNPRRYAS